MPGDHWKCIKYVRDPELKEWSLVWDPDSAIPEEMQDSLIGSAAIKYRRSLETTEKDLEDEDKDGYDEDEPRPSDLALQSGLEQSQSPSPLQWSPDKSYANTIFNVIRSAGTFGITTAVRS